MAESRSAPIRADIAVVGAGAAGLYAALAAAREGARVVLVSRSPLAQSASYWAQGGIAAAIAAEDSPDRHLADTRTAGRGTTRESAARVLCREAPARVRDLESLGVRFDADRHGALALGLEGGHSVRRVVHAGGSATGRRITRELSAIAAGHDRIEVLEHATAGAIWTLDGRCIGVSVDQEDIGRRAVVARATVLATGGAAALWQRTTNPRGAIGAGMTLAHAAGAALADMEMIQFHPTALASGGDRDGFLITEAVRGEGALLYDGNGERFVNELAPRDEVALAVKRKLDVGERVELDMTMVQQGQFPNIVNTLNEIGIDPYRERVPVAPAAHYTMGGIATDLDGGSTLHGLYAVGECACNGLHGANRLASNSLAECFVFGRRAALAGLAEPEPPSDPGEPPAEGPNPVPPRETRAALWRLAGIEREAGKLRELCDDPFPLARIVAASALTREESRGAHQRSDFPDPDARFDRMHAVARGDGVPRFERWD
jgi:L-aspartate oxidase